MTREEANRTLEDLCAVAEEKGKLAVVQWMLDQSAEDLARRAYRELLADTPERRAATIQRLRAFADGSAKPEAKQRVALALRSLEELMKGDESGQANS